jgi:hypothetical protein
MGESAAKFSCVPMKSVRQSSEHEDIKQEKRFAELKELQSPTKHDRGIQRIAQEAQTLPGMTITGPNKPKSHSLLHFHPVSRRNKQGHRSMKPPSKRT